MATWLQHNTANDTAGGYYVVIWRENTNAWKPATTAFAAYTTTRDDFDIQASQNGTTGHYRVQWPTAMHVGFMQWSWFKEASVGARSHANDTQVATGMGFWNGYRFCEGPDVHTTISTVTSQTVLVIDGSAGVAPQRDNSLIGFMARVSNPTAGENSSFTSSVRRITAHTYDSAGSTHSLTLAAAAEHTVAVGDSIEIYLPGTLVDDIQDQLDDIEGAIADVTSAGPIEHTHVPKSRILPVKSRGDGTIGVVGQVRQQPSETLWWAVDLAGSQLAPGDLINSMSAPSITGEDSANLTTPSYGVLATLAKFKVVTTSGADTTDVIYINLTLSPETGESLKVQVPVTILEAS
jgi:hypothetical protein